MYKSIRFLGIFFSLISLMLLTSCGGGYKFTGKVTNTRFKEVSNARVVIRDVTKDDSLVTTTGMDGLFLVEGIKNPDLEISIKADTYLPILKRITMNQKEIFETFQLNYHPTRIMGKVYDSKTQKPLSNVLVKVTPGNVTVLTNDQGEFVLEEGLDPDLDNVIFFSLQNYNVQSRTVKPELYRDTNLGEIYLTPLIDFSQLTETEVKRLSSADIDPTKSVGQTVRSNDIRNFLLRTEKFTFDEFSVMLRESTNRKFTDEEILEQLNEYVRLGQVKAEGINTYKSLIYDPTR